MVGRTCGLVSLSGMLSSRTVWKLASQNEHEPGGPVPRTKLLLSGVQGFSRRDSVFLFCWQWKRRALPTGASGLTPPGPPTASQALPVLETTDKRGP